MKERFKNWLTTCVGLAIILGALILWFLGKIDTTALTIALPFGFTYVVAKNSLITQGLLGNNEEIKRG